MCLCICHRGSLVGSATTVANRDTKLQSVAMAVKYHAPTDDSHTSRLPQDHKSHKKINKYSG